MSEKALENATTKTGCPILGLLFTQKIVILVFGCLDVWLSACLVGGFRRFSAWLLGLWVVVVWLFEGLVGGWVATRKTEIQIRR